MTVYLGSICQAMIIIIPLYICLSGNDCFYKSITILLCFACTYGYSYKLYGAISLVHILLVFMVIFKPNEYKEYGMKKRLCCSIDIFLYVIYVSLVTMVGYFLRSDYILKGSIIQNQFRPVVQIVFMIMTYFAVDSVKELSGAKSRMVLQIVYKFFLMLAIIGIVQEIIYIGTGVDVFPMMKDYAGAEGVSAISSNSLLRATAGVGEPKQLAKFLSFGFVMQLICHKFLGYERMKLSHIIIFAVGVFCSGSTTGFLIIAVGILFYFKTKAKGKATGMLIAILLSIILIPAVLSIPAIQSKLSSASSQGEIPGLENSDTAAVRWFINNPRYLFTGVGLANTVAYANEYAPWGSMFINSHPYTLRRGIIFHLAETGIIGLYLQSCIMRRLYSNVRSTLKISALFLFFTFTYMFLTLEAINQLLLITMALLSNCADFETTGYVDKLGEVE